MLEEMIIIIMWNERCILWRHHYYKTITNFNYFIFIVWKL